MGYVLSHVHILLLAIQIAGCDIAIIKDIMLTSIAI